MKFYLRDRNRAVVEAWSEFFGDDPDFNISQGDIFSGPKADAIVSPSNSWGFMDGGIDAVYIHRFGQKLEEDLKSLIKTNYHGELPVGQAVIIGTGDKDYPLLISAPTMRIPSVVKDTVNAYLAFRAVLIAVKPHKGNIKSILCPGLCTAVGEMKPWNCAKQMYEAYKAIWLDEPLNPKDCADIWYHQQQMTGWAPVEFQFDGRNVIKGK